MRKINHYTDELCQQRLFRRKLNRWTGLAYLPPEVGKKLADDYTDQRWSAAPTIKPLLFVATTIMLTGAALLITAVTPGMESLMLLLVGAGILWSYERMVSPRFYQAGIDESFVLIGTTFVILALLIAFDKAQVWHPFQFLLYAALAWLAAIRYRNYVVYYGAFLLLEFAFFEYAHYWEFPYLTFQGASVVAALCGWLYFYRQRKSGAAFLHRWNETLEVFFLTMIAVALNPYYQDLAYGVYAGTKSSLFSTDGWLVSSLAINAVFVLVLVCFGMIQQNRASLMIAFSTLFTGFLTIWFYYGQHWNVNQVLTLCGASVFGFGIAINYAFRKSRWNVIAAKLEYQEESFPIFDAVKKLRKKIRLKM